MTDPTNGKGYMTLRELVEWVASRDPIADAVEAEMFYIVMDEQKRIDGVLDD